MTTCEEVSHKSEDDGTAVREYLVYDDEAGDSYPRWLCDPCADELEACGVRMKATVGLHGTDV
jgi:hypothetical protein